MEEFLPPETPHRSFVAPLIIILLGVSLGGGYLYLFVAYPALFADPGKRISDYVTSLRSVASPTPTSIPAPIQEKTIVPLPTGAQTYNFSHGTEVNGPKISQLTLDPLAINIGETQTITLKATHPSPITSVSVELITDTMSTPHTLTKISGTGTDGTWSGSWEVKDTINARYGLRLILNSSDSNYDNTMWFR